MSILPLKLGFFNVFSARDSSEFLKIQKSQNLVSSPLISNTMFRF